jgi:hypothetical protein
MLPSALKGVLKAGRFGTEGAKTLRGDEVVPLSYGDLALQFLGYTPGAYARTQERVSGEKRIDEAIRTKKRKLYRKYYLAYLDKDFEEMRDVLRDMQEFSRENPDEAITGSSLSQSLKSNLQRSAEMIGGVSFTKSGRGRAEASLGEYDDDISIWSD